MNVEFTEHLQAPSWAPPAPPPPPQPPGASAPRRWGLVPRSLTSRLVVGVAILVIMVVGAVGTGTYFALRSFLYARLDQQVRTTVAQSPVSLGNDQATSGQPHAPQALWLVLLDMAGNELYRPNPDVAETLLLSPAEGAELAADLRAGRDPLTTLTATDGGTLRVSARATTYQGVPVVFAVGLSTDEVARTLGHLVVLELIIGSSAVILSLVATGWGVRFSLRRLHQVTATAQEVAAELSPEGAGLERRVEVHESGTEVGKLAESMNTLLSAVETQFAARLDSEWRMRQFLADASHELRTPLTSIRGYAELVRMQRALGGPEADEVTDDNLQRIESEGTRMSRLVEDLLTLARGDQGLRAEVEPVDVAELLDEVVAGSHAAFPEREFRCTVPADLAVIGDHDQLLRAVRNLVTNAATHTGPDGPIEVTAFASGQGVVIQVSDRGPGLPPEEAAHVFERFWRADKARSRVRGGSGLGLAIVAAIVYAHGGTVQFQSTPASGSTVTVWLPSPPA